MIENINMPYELYWPLPSREKIVRIHALSENENIYDIVNNIVSSYTDMTQKIYVAMTMDMLQHIDFTKIGHVSLYVELTSMRDVDALVALREVLRKMDIKIALHINQIEFYVALEKIFGLEDVSYRVDLGLDVIKKMSVGNWRKMIEKVIASPRVVDRVFPMRYFLEYAIMLRNKQANTYNMWQLFSEQLGFFYHVKDDGKVTLSPRWEKEGSVFGSTKDSFSKIQESGFFQELEKLEDDIFFKYADCSVCEKYDFCKSTLKFHDMEYDCSTFKSAMDDLLVNIEKIIAIYEAEGRES